MVSYQLAVKGSRNLAALKSHNFMVLFWTMNVVGSPPSKRMETSTKKMWTILHHLIHKLRILGFILNLSHGASWITVKLPSCLTLSSFPRRIWRKLPAASVRPPANWRFLKDVVQTVGPDNLCIINLALPSGSFPTSFKNCPLLEKKTLDPNFRPKFSNFKYLLFLSKILEKCVSSQIIMDTQTSMVYLKNINRVLMPTTAQKQLSSRTVSTNDLLLTADSWTCAILILLDFYFIYHLDHDILLHHLEKFGGHGPGLILLLIASS